MTHYIRWKSDTLVEAETATADLSCVVYIGTYSHFLLGFAEPSDVIKDFDDLQEMRGEWHEDVESFESPDEFTERKLGDIARKYGLHYTKG